MNDARLCRPHDWSPEEILLLDILRGRAVEWPPGNSSFDEAFVEAGRRHAVLPLVFDRLHGTPEWDRCPESIRNRLASRKEGTVIDLVRDWELREVLASLYRRHVHPLILKGGALSYTLYPSVHLRPRYDTDLLIRLDEPPTAWEVLRNRGYERPNSVQGQFVAYEFLCWRKDDRGIEHVLDVHWRLSSTQLFAQAFSYEELARDSVPVGALGPAARTPSALHALLVALMHRISHARYGGGDRLVWLYDIHLLAQALGEREWQRLTKLAEEKQLRGVCLDGLLSARSAFGTPLPEASMHRLAVSREKDLSRAYVGKRPWSYLLVDLKAVSHWRGRLTLLGEKFFPSADYMMKKYQTRHRFLLPVLWAHRIVTGIWKYL